MAVRFDPILGLLRMRDTVDNGSILKIATITGINAKTVATTSLYTVPTGKSLIVTLFVVRVTAFTAGGKTVQAIYNVGGNATDYNNILNSVSPTIGAVNEYYPIILLDGTNLAVQAATTVLTLNITTGSNATTETWAVDVFGYLV